VSSLVERTHATVDDEGRPRRIPREERDTLQKLCASPALAP
jgi:acyl-CoA thioesterase FadM